MKLWQYGLAIILRKLLSNLGNRILWLFLSSKVTLYLSIKHESEGIRFFSQHFMSQSSQSGTIQLIQGVTLTSSTYAFLFHFLFICPQQTPNQHRCTLEVLGNFFYRASKSRSHARQKMVYNFFSFLNIVMFGLFLKII